MNKKILGMGNAVLDIVSPVSDDFLASANLTKGVDDIGRPECI